MKTPKMPPGLRGDARGVSGAPRMRMRAPGLPISVGGAGAHTAPASPTLTLAVGVVCAAQNRLPKA